MKKFKNLTIISILFIFIFVLTGCQIRFFFEKEETFTNEGLSITLTNNFYEKEHIAFTSYYESNNMMVVVIKENYSILSSVGITKDSSLENYLKTVILANKHDSSVKEEDDITYFDYVSSEGGKDFKYVVTAVKGSEAIYLVQFCVVEDTYDDYKDDIFEYAKSLEAE